MSSKMKSTVSITRRLNVASMLRLLSVMLSLDVLICLLAAGVLLYYCENKGAEAGKLIAYFGLPQVSESAFSWAELAGVEVQALEEEEEEEDGEGQWKGVRNAKTPSPGPGSPSGQLTIRIPTLPAPFSAILPENTRAAARHIEYAGGKVYYALTLPIGTALARITINVSGFLFLFTVCFAVLVLVELLTVISEAEKNRRMVRKMLDPITELTKAAQNLNAASKHLDPEKMAALAGKLEDIDAARLDTRIPIEETQDELKNLAQAINNMLDRINEAYKVQIRFVSDASHELRTPISVIQGYANLLDRWGKHDEKTLQEAINAIKEEAANMKDLVEQLLFLARGDNNTIMLQAELCDLAEIVAEVAEETKMLDNTHVLELKTANAPVVADKALIKQALRILVDNAVKYTDPGGKITLACGLDNGYAKMSVTDTGIGIPAEAVPRIFDRFYRTDESRSRATGGAGLGLSIAKWIATRHDGYMEVLSREGIGTRITIVLPAASPAVSGEVGN
ncbi:MAG TPA: HAMP domain-containing protein [Firmicutes bacterium]|nr:HAMP domain-containing protein [Bacillota bacterium]